MNLKKYLLAGALLFSFMLNSILTLDNYAELIDLNNSIIDIQKENHFLESELQNTYENLEYSENQLQNAKIQLKNTKIDLISTEEQNSYLKTEIENIKSDVNFIYDGEFTITYYCGENYPHICDSANGATSSGAKAFDGVTVAADPNIIPEGTYIYIEGIGMRVVQDIGGGIKGNRLDIYVDTHEEALSKNVVTTSVWHVGKDD